MKAFAKRILEDPFQSAKDLYFPFWMERRFLEEAGSILRETETFFNNR